MLYFLGGKCAIHVFSWRESTQEMVWASVTIVVTLKNRFTLGNCFQVFHTRTPLKAERNRARDKTLW